MKKKYSLTVLFFYFAAKSLMAQEPSTKADSVETWSYHFQFTGTNQYHGDFFAKYSGENSLSNKIENPLSVTATLYFGRTLWKGGEVYFNPEMSGGSGFSKTRGVAGFPNGEVYRVDDVTPKVFVARAFLRQHFTLESGGETEKNEADQNQLAGNLPKSRLTLTAGKFSLTDIFDANDFSKDPRTQFMNWAMWSPAAWDYAADTRGYNYGFAAELRQPAWTLNVAAVMVPTTANGPVFDTHLDKAFSLNAEFVKPYKWFERGGRLHVIAYLNHADMGNYREAIDQAGSGTPDVTKTQTYSSKYGVAACIEQPLTEAIGLFSRLSWNDGKTETWAFTEIDRSFQIGLNVKGERWQRKEDNFGIGVVLNSLSQDHRDYLADGGYGFIIGDGHLNYGLEQILETFYSAKLTPSFWLSLDNQLIFNPAYNRDRGPVDAIAVRGHVEF
jgi:high affinity Mn2+ porin